MNTTPPTSAFPPALARIVATVSIGFVVTQLDVTIVNIALAHLAADRHLPVAGLQWVVDAYTLAFAVLMLSGGALGAAIGYESLHFIDASTPLPLLLAPFLLIPTGMGFAVPAMTTAVLASVEHERAGIASAVLNTARQAGGAMGVATFGALAGGGDAWQAVDGLHIGTAVSVVLLIAAALIATLVRPDAHRCAAGARQVVSAADWAERSRVAGIAWTVACRTLRRYASGQDDRAWQPPSACSR
ncbi:hypothetical protein LGM65_01285 [Burkholderia anthina]|uniref:hypothetical protein n=1 Tax=Burkholderia anthina TaxID=179879 RepID=UPI001CF3D675|nr:hypothetical protein [Burkholderia anthina]MCA8089528.1 hypothetical protein [Burkholderia anthina]